MDKWTCAEAAKRSHLSFLQYARDIGCPWDKTTMDETAALGDLTTLQWARANGCPWDAETMNRAAAEGRFSIVKWLKAEGCPWSRMTTVAFARERGMRTGSKRTGVRNFASRPIAVAVGLCPCCSSR